MLFKSHIFKLFLLFVVISLTFAAPANAENNSHKKSPPNDIEALLANYKRQQTERKMLRSLGVDAPKATLSSDETTRVWTGNGDNYYWNDASNWTPYGAPNSSNTIGFSSNIYAGDASTYNNLNSLSVSYIGFIGESPYGYNLNGNSVKLTGGIFDSNEDPESFNFVSTGISAASNLDISGWAASNLVLNSNISMGSKKLTLNSDEDNMIFITKKISGTGSVTVRGLGYGVFLTSGNTSKISGPVTVNGNGLLGGKGKIGKLTTKSTGHISPTGCLYTKSVSLGGTFNSQLRGASSCNKDKLGVTGSVTIASGSQLKTTLKSGYKPKKGAKFTLITNDKSDKIKGRFKNRPEGHKFNIGNYRFKITYKGGSGKNDVVLTRL